MSIHPSIHMDSGQRYKNHLLSQEHVPHILIEIVLGNVSTHTVIWMDYEKDSYLKVVLLRLVLQKFCLYENSQNLYNHARCKTGRKDFHSSPFV